MRTIIIGDIHGCSGALRLLLAKIMPDEKADRLILLGDLFERGPDSWGVFQMVREHVVPFYRGEGFQCVHAGLKVDPIEMNDYYTMIHDHGVAMENRYAGPLTIVGHIALEKVTWFPGLEQPVKQIPEGTWQELPQRGVICIDTGCGDDARALASGGFLQVIQFR